MGSATEAVELLAVNAADETGIVPSENGEEDLIEIEQTERIGYRDDPNHHGAYVAENRSQNQSVEGRFDNHSSSLPAVPQPAPRVAAALLDHWLAEAGFSAGLALGAVNKGGRITGQGMSPQSIYEVIEAYGKALGAALTPHDVRRTFAKVAHKGRAPLEQIQISLGHASIQTTERYLGVEQDLTDAPCDHLGIRARNSSK
jgi:hypothetical protein